MLCLDILMRSQPPRIPRAIADRFVPRLPLVGTLFARVGVVSGTRANVRRLLERGELVAIWPEGVSGPAKPFRERYEIQRWSVGFAELAIRYGAPVIPAATIGAEESWPVLARFRSLRAFGAPYLPVPMSPVPLPTHYHIRYGVPLRFDAEPEAADDPHVVAAAAEQVLESLERLIADARNARRGVFR
jgi:1-acyl-sn-glycerol-3-phosphate acyltransferase